MFAPQPIQIRYGSDGLLGQAAVAAGQGAANQQAHAQDMMFLSHELDRRSAMTQFLMNDDMEGRKLQAAQDLSLSRGSTATSGYSGNGYSPLTQAVLNAKNTILSNVSPNLPADQQATLQALARSPDVNAEQFNTTAQKLVQEGQDTKAKQGVLAEARGKLDPEDMDLIAGYANDSKYSSNDLRLAIQNSMKKRSAKEGVKTQQTQKQALWQQAVNSIPREDAAAIQPLVDDPKVTTEQLKNAVVQSYTRAKAGQTASLSQRLIQSRFDIGQLSQQAKAIEKAHPEIDFTAGPEQFAADDTEGKGIYAQWQQIHQQAQTVHTQANGLLGSGQQQQQVQMGAVIQTPRGNVKVVGFDTDGHPLVEPQ